MTSPFAIDLAFKVAEDIGLPSKMNDWITVSFLWTGNWGSNISNSNPQAQLTPGNLGAGAEFIPSVATAAPADDGSITHQVKNGETLWAIAMAYHMRVAQIQLLNNMGQTIVIFEGQRLVIKEAGPTWTPLPASVSPKTLTAEAIQTPQPSGDSAQLTASATPYRETPEITPYNLSLEKTSTATAQPSVSTASPPTTATFIHPPPETNSRWVTENAFLFGGLVIAGVGGLILMIGWIISRSIH